MKSTAVVFPKAQEVQLVEEEVADPAPDEILCQAEKSLISIGTELQCLRGVFDAGTNWQNWVKYPFRPGYSMVARIIKAGKDVPGSREGQLVAVSQPHAQYFVTKAQRAIPVPDGVSAEQAAWTSLSITAQLGVRRAELELGESVAVVGLGMVGQMVTQYLRLMGPAEIVAIDTVDSRLRIARESGITDELQTDVQSAASRVSEITGKRMLDAVFEVTGNPSVLPHALQLLRKRGRLVLVGDTSTPTQQSLGPGVVSNALSILGVHNTTHPAESTVYARWSYEEMAQLFYRYLLDGRMHTDHLNLHRHHFSDAPKVYETIVKDRTPYMGVLFEWK